MEILEVNFALLEFGFRVHVHCDHSISPTFHFGVHLDLGKHIYNRIVNQDQGKDLWPRL